MVDAVERLRELNVSFPEMKVKKDLPIFAIFHGLSLTDAIERMIAEAELVDKVIKENHRDIVDCGLGRKVISNAMKIKSAKGFAEREFVVREGWIFNDDIAVNEEGKPRYPLSVTNRHVLEDDFEYWAPYTQLIGAPTEAGELWLDRGITAFDYDVVFNCFKKVASLEAEGRVTWVGSFSDCFDIPANLSDGFAPERHVSNYMY